MGEIIAQRGRGLAKVICYDGLGHAVKGSKVRGGSLADASHCRNGADSAIVTGKIS